MDKEQLAQILENHKHWLNEDCEGWENMRADLSGQNLDGASLNRALLDGASLDRASLNGASLDRASLNEASLNGASLNGASLDRALLDRASLNGASLNGASLNGASLDRASLNEASLNGASLNRASLNRASLYGADLRNIKIDENTKIHVPYACPEFGSFIGWKKASNKIVCLEILEDAVRCSATTRKCRCSKAKVLSIANLDGTGAGLTEVASSYDRSFIYKVGEIVEVKDFNMDRWQECSEGIHFFITRQEAVEW